MFDSVKAELTVSNPEAFDKLPQEMQDYQSYIVNDFLINKKGILSLDAIDASDATYIAWSKDHSISLKEFLTYAAVRTGLIFHNSMQKKNIWILLRFTMRCPII